MLKHSFAMGAVSLSAALLPTTAMANTDTTWNDDGTMSATVSYADLNLAISRDVGVLQYRIGAAAHDVCGQPFAHETFLNPERRICIDSAVASAQPAFDAAVSAARNGTIGITYGAALTVTAPKW